MDTETKKALAKFENTIDEAISELSDVITYDELVEYFADMKIVDCW